MTDRRAELLRSPEFKALAAAARIAKKPPLYIQFWAKVRLGNGCWEWRGSKNDTGYGQIRINKVLKRATHTMWFMRYSVWPERFLLHSCDNPACVNPAHLSEGNQAENIRQAMERERHWKFRYTHCKYGHEITGQTPRQRYCLICKRAADRLWRNKNGLSIPK